MYDQFQQRGAVVAAISVDSVERNQAMIDKLLLPFPLLSDPDRQVIAMYGIADPKEPIARPALFVIGQDRTVHYAYVGQDFSDRPGDEEIWRALDNLRSTSAERRSTIWRGSH
jgi:peroxiredoxin